MIKNVALIAALFIATVSNFGVPVAMAGAPTPSIRPYPGHFVCTPPKVLTKACVSWGKAGAGQLFGPCLKYQMQCEAPAHIQ